tara:strand:+ start:205 stop:480 length:276 start_codon:yes stop_codon:yes gene_type:complete
MDLLRVPSCVTVAFEGLAEVKVADEDPGGGMRGEESIPELSYFATKLLGFSKLSSAISLCSSGEAYDSSLATSHTYNDCKKSILRNTNPHR